MGFSRVQALAAGTCLAQVGGGPARWEVLSSVCQNAAACFPACFASQPDHLINSLVLFIASACAFGAFLVCTYAGVDVFVYFSHHLVTIPPKGWIHAAHKHGVKVRTAVECCCCHCFAAATALRLPPLLCGCRPSKGALHWVQDGACSQPTHEAGKPALRLSLQPSHRRYLHPLPRPSVSPAAGATTPHRCWAHS